MALNDTSDATMNSSPAPARLIYPVHVEVRVKNRNKTRSDVIRALIHKHILGDQHLVVPSVITGWEKNQILAESVDRVIACESASPSACLPLNQVSLSIHVYQHESTEAFSEFSTGVEGEEVTAAAVSELPCLPWEGLWDSLIYADDVKAKLLNYIYSTMLFADAGVDLNIISWNRVVLLHGPPGTGKTSLCRGLAQKLSIRLSHRYANVKLLEINSHSLFSRWFSESGKLVQKLFASITDLVDDEDTFVIVLIDEVESLTAARAGAMAGTEPSDALRVVNALLTQLDRLKTRKNVLVMATSNLVNAIDTAFIDRADIVQYIGLPPTEAIYEILRTCLAELMSKGVIQHMNVPEFVQADSWTRAGGSGRRKDIALRLLSLAERCKGMSGRALRRLPVLAHARFVNSGIPMPTRTVAAADDNRTADSGSGQIGLIMSHNAFEVEQWLMGMESVVQDLSVSSLDPSRVL